LLVLSRHKNESIIIKKDSLQVEVTVVDIRGDKVRIGVEAPRDVTVHREEVQRAIDRERGIKRTPSQMKSITVTLPNDRYQELADVAKFMGCDVEHVASIVMVSGLVAMAKTQNDETAMVSMDVVNDLQTEGASRYGD
jgi:carbon storage regulator